MKKLFLSLFLFTPLFAHAQAVSINTDGSNPAPSAILDVKSTEKGMLVPRMSTAQRTAIAAPAAGLLVFDTDTGGFWFYNGTAWTKLNSSSAPPTFIADTDGNTKVQTEESPNEDVIRFDLGGTEHLALRRNPGGIPRLELSNSNSNTFLGQDAGAANTTGNSNTATGKNALLSNTTGFSNTAHGMIALSSNTTGKLNTASGIAALTLNTTGIQNTAHGANALLFNSAGQGNTAVGFEALTGNTTGFSNTAVGVNALQSNTGQSNLVAVGDSALYHNGVGAINIFHASGNTAIGSKTLYANTTGFNNSAIGSNALYANTSGSSNTAGGFKALYANTTGHSNTANGAFAINANTTGISNTANGYAALYFNTSGNNNTAHGYQALFSNTTGSSNTATGVSALQANTTGYDNTANGERALFSNTTGERNTAIGIEALHNNTTGSINTATGSNALGYNTTGSSNTANGNGALIFNTTGDNNTANGHIALYVNYTGNNNTASGYSALSENTLGDNNTAIGYFAGATSNAYQNTNCTFIGSITGQPFNTNFDNSTALGNNARITASNQVRIGNSDVTSIGGFAAWTNLSDQRFKKNLRDDVPGLSFILQLRPVTYNMDVPALAAHLQEDRTGALDTARGIPYRQPDALTLDSRAAKSRIRYTGFVAQEVERAAQAIGYAFSGVDKPENETGLYGLRYSEFVVPIVKAVQEQQDGIEKLEAENAVLKAQLQQIMAALQTAGIGVEDK